MKKLLIFTLILAVAGSTGLYLFRYIKHKEVAGALTYGRLATLPLTAQHLEVETAGSLFSRTFWLRFAAPDTAIHGWVRRSPSLAGQAPALVLPQVFSSPDTPDWFTPSAILKGQVFQIPQDEHTFYGTVWLDEANGIVYIKTSHS